jgi:RNA polymerase sigma factor (sigma-70 family)
MNDDAVLLRHYADSRDEAAFAELVRRHLGLVYHAALRQTGGDAHRAQDVAQEVFTSLARKARVLAQRPTLAGWLHTSTRYAALQAVRSERRRQNREQEAYAMSEALRSEAAGAEWEQLKPFVDEALHSLGEQDREAVLLRFFEGRAFAEVGTKLAVSEDAARVRVNRALEKLRLRLMRHGVTSTAALAAMLAAQAGAAVPVGLTATITTGVLTAGGAPALLYTFMNLTKLKIALGIGVAATGVATLVVQQREIVVLRAEADRPAFLLPADEALRLENVALKTQVGRLENQRRDDGELIQLMGEESGMKARVIETMQKRSSASEANVARLAARLAELSPYSVKELDRMPALSVPLPPIYPAELKQAGVEGEALMEFVIDRTGAVTEVKAVRSTHLEFEVAAEEALKQWKFTPGQKGGLAVNTRVQQVLKFELPKPQNGGG